MHAPSAASPRILLAEPGGTSRRLMAARLLAGGAAVECADSPREALALLREGAADHVLVHCALAAEHGVDWMTAIDPGAWITPIADPSARGLEEMQTRLGAVAMIERPVDDLTLERFLAPHDSERLALDEERWEELMAIARAAPDALDRVVQGYLRGVPERVERLRKALEDGNAEELVRLAHSWKGAAAGVGADRLADALARLEQCARNNDHLGIRRLARVAVLRARASSRALHRRMGRLAAPS